MKIIGLISTLNDEDIIQEVVEHLIFQGLELVVLDNGSTDKTYEICEGFLGKGIVSLKQIKTSWFKLDLILRMEYDMAIEQSPDWIVRCDSDEFFESGQKGVTLKDAIEKIDSEGYNLIQLDRFDFFMTDDDRKSEESIRKKMPYYSYQGDFVYRAWKYAPGIGVGDIEGHYPIFPEGKGYKISPNKFVLRHYSFRSEEQAQRKISHATRGITKNNPDRKINRHIKRIIKNDGTKVFDHRILTKYLEDGNWNKELKFCPFAWENPPKKEDLFTKDGNLIEPPRTVTDYKRLLEEEKDSNSISSLLFKTARYVKRKIDNKESES